MKALLNLKLRFLENIDDLRAGCAIAKLLRARISPMLKLMPDRGFDGGSIVIRVRHIGTMLPVRLARCAILC